MPLRAPPVEVWYHPDYRPPISGLETTSGVEPRRADFVAWFLARRQGFVLHPPRPISYARLARVHTDEYLDSLQTAERLAHIFAVEPSDVPVAQVLRTVRLACGGTLAAAHATLRSRRPTLNLSGGFHHAARAHGGGFCAVNDVAVAIADLRAEGFAGQIAVIDLDAHPPDGTADCLVGDERSWLGSLSGSDWGPLPHGVEKVLPAGAGDLRYVHALRGLLAQMPKSELVFVIAGGDVLRRDALGQLGLSERGARLRDWAVLRAISGTPSVWLPGGGYHARAWRVLAGTALVLSGRPLVRVPSASPLRVHFEEIAREFRIESLGQEPLLTQAELDESLGKVNGPPTFLGFYTSEGIEYALQRFGLLAQLRRLGYSRFEVEIRKQDLGDSMRLTAEAEGQRHVLIECTLERQLLGERQVLFVHWLSLRNPRAQFGPARPPLPGQDAPGLGLAREVGEVLGRIAQRLGLSGVALRPAWYHVAYASRYEYRFVDPARQGRFEALMRDLRGVPLLEATRAVADKRVLLDGKPYEWEAEPMVMWLDAAPESQRREIEAERDRVKFTLAQVGLAGS